MIFDERGKLEYPEKNLSQQSGEPTNSIHIWRCVWKLNPGHIGWRQVLSTLSPTMIYTRWIKQHWLLVTFLTDFIWKQYNFDTYLKHYKKTIQRNSKVKRKSPAERYKEFIALEFSRLSNIFSSMQMHILLCQVSILIISKFLAQDNDFPSLWLVP